MPHKSLVNPDLEFSGNATWALSQKGNHFFATLPFAATQRDIYKQAIEQNLRVSFDTAETQDRLAAIPAVSEAK